MTGSNRLAGLAPGHIARYATPSPADLERIAWQAVRSSYADACSRRITEFQAVSSISSAARDIDLADDDLRRALLLTADLSVQQLDDNAVLLATLLLELVESSGAEEDSWAYRSAVYRYIACGTFRLFSMPTGILFRALDELASRRLAIARAGDDLEEIADALRLAAGIRTFFVLEKRDLAWWSAESNWMRLLAVHVDPAVLSGPMREELRPPDPGKEMHTAEAMLSELVNLQAGVERARSQVSLVEFRLALGQNVLNSPDSVVGRLLEVVDIGDMHLRMSALLLLDSLGMLAAARGISRVYDGSLADTASQMGPSAAVQEFRTAAWVAMRIGRHQEAADLTRQYLALDLSGASDEELTQALDVAVHCGDEGISECVDIPIEEAGSIRRRILSSAEPGQLGPCLLHAALHTPTLKAADELLAEPDIMRPTWRGTLNKLRKYVRARVAYTEYERRSSQPGHERAKIELLVTSLRLFASLGSAYAVRSVLTQLAREVRWSPEIAQFTVMQLAPLLDRVLLSVDEIEDEVAALGEAMAFPVRYPEADPEAACFVHSQLFKAPQMAAVIRNSGPFPPDEREARLDYEIQTLPSDGGQDPEKSNPPFLGENVDNELLTVLYAVSSEFQSGGTLEERRHNLQISCDQAVRQRLYRERGNLDIRREAPRYESGKQNRGRLMSLSDLEGCLDERTLLADFFDGPTDTGARCNYVTTYSQRHWEADALVGPREHGIGVLVDPRHPGRVLKAHGDAYGLAELRRLLVDSPGPRRPVSRQARERLEASPLVALGRVLTEYAAAGYDRLCVWPHATSHYAPLHLMHVNGQPLADDWLITSIPSVACLLSKHERMAGASPLPKREITVLAASSPDGGMEAGYPTVSELEMQAAQVANSHASSFCLAPAAATPSALLELMPHSRYVHLAAHGSANPFAPSYQTLYFTGTSGSGWLTARALMQADLRGIDLVTLSACESALGRFDLLDNQAGIVSSLLGAGVTAVIACLWPVRPEPSSFFFVSLYGFLSQQSEPIDFRGAFRSAQLATRSQFPAYRDWGAFIYTGGW